MTALKLINEWCDMADEKNLFIHKAIFWKARDIIENELQVPKELKQECYLFIKEHCKDSNDRKIILDEIKKHM